MYDKYISGNTLPIDAKLPKIKGLAIFGNGNASFYIVNDQGNTIGMTLGFSGGMTILPMQVHTVRPLPAGLTGMYLN